MELLALLPWWAALGVGVVSYWVLHALATPPTLNGVQPGQLGSAITRSMFASLAGVGQYLLPMLCTGAAVISWLRRRRRAGLVSKVASAEGPVSLRDMSWQEFELLVGEAYRLQGYRVVETGGAGPDGGVDLILHRAGEKYLVQCKQWKAFKVPVQVVRELYGLMAAHGAAGGFVVTSGHFTSEAEAFARGREVTLLDGERLFEMIRVAKASLADRNAREPSGMDARSATAGAGATQSRPAQAPSVPECPVCSKPMVERLAKRGANAGSSFWGCSAYPSCRGTRR